MLSGDSGAGLSTIGHPISKRGEELSRPPIMTGAFQGNMARGDRRSGSTQHQNVHWTDPGRTSRKGDHGGVVDHPLDHRGNRTNVTVSTYRRVPPISSICCSTAQQGARCRELLADTAQTPPRARPGSSAAMGPCRNACCAASTARSTSANSACGRFGRRPSRSPARG